MIRNVELPFNFKSNGNFTQCQSISKILWWSLKKEAKNTGLFFELFIILASFFDVRLCRCGMCQGFDVTQPWKKLILWC